MKHFEDSAEQLCKCGGEMQETARQGKIDMQIWLVCKECGYEERLP